MTTTLEDPTTVEVLLGTVGAAMTRDVVLVAADMGAELALRRLDRGAVSGAPVVERGRVVGVVTRRDLLVPTLAEAPAGSAGPLGGGSWNRPVGLRVSDLMSDEPVTVTPDRPLVEAVRTMLGRGVNRVPVIDRAGRPLGILTRDDVLRAVAGCH
jgi:CBS domain-containing protein